MKKIVLVEFILVMITGVLFTLVKLYENGIGFVKELVNFVETDPVIVYTLFIFFLLSVLSRMLRKFWGVSLYHYKNHMIVAEEVFEGVGSSLLSIYRIAIGIAIAVPIVWYFWENETFILKQAVVIEGIGVIFFVGLCMLSRMSDMSKKVNDN